MKAKLVFENLEDVFQPKSMKDFGNINPSRLLIQAARSSNLEAANIAINLGGSFKEEFEDGADALYWATQNDNIEIVKELLKLNPSESVLFRSIYYASINNKKLDLIELLLKAVGYLPKLNYDNILRNKKDKFKGFFNPIMKLLKKYVK